MELLKEKIRDLKNLAQEPIVLTLVLFCIAVLAVFVIYPLFSVFRQSVLNDTDQFIGIKNYIAFFTNPYFRQVLFNTLLISSLATAGAIFVGSTFGYAKHGILSCILN